MWHHVAVQPAQATPLKNSCCSVLSYQPSVSSCQPTQRVKLAGSDVGTGLQETAGCHQLHWQLPDRQRVASDHDSEGEAVGRSNSPTVTQKESPMM